MKHLFWNLKYSSQKGIALLSALLTATLISALLVGFYLKSAVKSQEVRSDEWVRQIYFHQKTLEHMATRLLRLSREKTPYDYASAVWNRRISLPIDGGMSVLVSMKDLNQRLNLNNLYEFDDFAYEKNKLNPKIASFLRLYQALLKLGGFDADFLSALLIDWIDQNTNVTKLKHGTGGEDEFYYNQTPSLLTANEPLSWLSELSLLPPYQQKGSSNISAIDFLRPWVSTLPDFTPININTLRCDSKIYEVILGTYKNGVSLICPATDLLDDKLLTLSDALLLQPKAPKSHYYSSVDEFYNKLKSLGPPPAPFSKWEDLIPKESLSVVSTFFEVDGVYSSGNCVLKASSILNFKDNKMRVVRRFFGEPLCQK